MSGLSPAARKELASLSPEERVEALRALVPRRALLRAAGLCANHRNHHAGYGALCLRPAGHEAEDDGLPITSDGWHKEDGWNWGSDHGTPWDEEPPPRPPWENALEGLRKAAEGIDFGQCQWDELNDA